MKHLTTKLLVAVTLAAAAIVGAVGPASAQTKTKLRVSMIPIIDAAPLFAAIQQGYFAKEGIEIDAKRAVGGNTGIRGAVAGVYDIVYTAFTSTVQAKVQGIDVLVITAGSKNSPTPPDTAAMIKRKGDPIKTGADLHGKRVAVNARNNVNWLFAAAWIRKTGGDPSKVTFREVPFPQMVDALKTNQVDAANAVNPFLSFGLRDPKVELLSWAFSEVLPGAQIAQWVVTPETASKKEEVLRGFVRGMRKGADWLNANVGTDAFFKVFGSFSRLKPQQLKHMKFRRFTSDVDLDSMRGMIGLMRENGLIEKEIDPLTMIWKEALPK